MIFLIFQEQPEISNKFETERLKIKDADTFNFSKKSKYKAFVEWTHEYNINSNTSDIQRTHVFDPCKRLIWVSDYIEWSMLINSQCNETHSLFDMNRNLIHLLQRMSFQNNLKCHSF